MAVSAKVASAYVDLVARTESFKTALADATGEVRKFQGQVRAETEKSRESVRLLSESIGLGIPRALTNVISKLPMVSAAMNAAFDAVIVIGLIDMVVKAGEKIAEFVKKNEDAARKNAEAWQGAIGSITTENDKLELTNTKLDNTIAKLEHKPQNMLKQAIEEAKVAADELGTRLDEDIKKVSDVLKSEEHGWAAQMFLKQTGGNASANIAADVRDKFNQIAAGTFKQGTGNQTADRDAVIQMAIAAAYSELAPAQKLADQVAANFGGKAPATSSSAEDVRSLTELIAALRGMQTTSTLTQEQAPKQAQVDLLIAAKEAQADADKQAQLRLRAFETAFDQQRQLYGMDVFAELNYWGSKLSVFKVGSQQYLSVLEKFGTAEKGLRVEMKAATARETSEPPVFRADDARGADQLAAAITRDREAQAALNFEWTQARDKADLLTGAITPHQAAMDIAADHAADYTAKLNALKDQLAALEQERPEGIGGFSNEQTAKQVAVGTQIEDLEGKRRVQELEDNLAEINTTWRGMVDGVFDEMIKKSAETQQQIAHVAIQTVDSLNSEMAKSVLGEKTDYKKVFQGSAESLLKTGFSSIEGSALKLFGLGSKKADGSAENPFHVISARGVGANSPGDMDALFKSLPQPKVSGPSGMNLESTATKGLLGMLNDSNWAASLFGGRLFGAGGFFGGGHALGGAAPAGVPIDIGELGPERFTPSVSGTVTSNRDLTRQQVVMHIDARGTDPALTRENFQRALVATHAQAVHDASRAVYEHSRRVAH